MSQPLIDLQHISKSFDGELILDDLNLSIRENSFVTLLGPSGCGKTTTLRILGGFTSPDTGRVLFDGQDITKLPPNKRQLNTVFQKYALFPHMRRRSLIWLWYFIWIMAVVITPLLRRTWLPLPVQILILPSLRQWHP